jgi:hypothetical protein
MGIAEVVSAVRSPWQNAYVERVIGSIRRDCLEQIVILNERHQRRVLSTYIATTTAPISHSTRIARNRARHPTQDRKGRRHPTSQWRASPLRTPRRLLIFAYQWLERCQYAPSDDRSIRAFDLKNAMNIRLLGAVDPFFQCNLKINFSRLLNSASD